MLGGRYAEDVHVAVFTGSRADYGLLRWPIEEMTKAPDFHVSIVAGGSHLSPAFDYSVHEIENDGFHITRRIESLVSSDSGNGMAKSIALGVAGLADAIQAIDPDAVMILGDRFESLAAAIAAMSLRVPIVHLHGGELTAGLIDEAVRHSITKMSHVHFVATENYRRRVIQMGEQPNSVHTVGAVGLDALASMAVTSHEQLEEMLGRRLPDRNVLVVYHPETLSTQGSPEIVPLLHALDDYRDVGVVFSLPNADPGRRAIEDDVRKFAKDRENVSVVQNLGRDLFLKCLSAFQGIVGNSSSGIIEAPSLVSGTVNVGNRQKGRDMASSVVSCENEVNQIGMAVELMLSPSFQASLPAAVNPYGGPGASRKLVEVLRRTSLEPLLQKNFYDLESS